MVAANRQRQPGLVWLIFRRGAVRLNEKVLECAQLQHSAGRAKVPPLGQTGGSASLECLAIATRARPIAHRLRAANSATPQHIDSFKKFGAPGTIRTSDPQIRSRLEQIQNVIFKALILFAFACMPLR